MRWYEYPIILLALLLSPIWLPLVMIANIKKCPHFYTNCPGSYALNKQCGMYEAKHNCLHYWELEEK